MHSKSLQWQVPLLSIFCAAYGEPLQYSLVDLGGTGEAINNAGQVVGTFGALIAPGQFRSMAFRTPAGAAGPINPDRDNIGMPGAYASSAFGINDSGTTVGAYRPSGPSGDWHAFRVAPQGKLADSGTDLGTLGGTFSYARAINSTGQIVGFSGLANDATHAFRLPAGSSALNPGDDLGTLGGRDSQAYAVNASGQVVGEAYLPGDNDAHAFRTSPNGRISDPGADLGTLGGSWSSANDINDAGQVVGDSAVTGNGSYHAFRTSPGGYIQDAGTDLGTLGGTYSEANAINNAGTVVGWATLAPIGPYGMQAWRAFICYPGAPMQDLNGFVDPASGWTLAEAVDINDLGQILVRGMRDPDGAGPMGLAEGYCVLTPVPEPTTLVLLAAACMPLMQRKSN